MNGRMIVQLRRYGRSFLILLLLMVCGVIAGGYILINQRFPNPFQSFYKVNAAFPTAAAVVPGLGEPVNVAGVNVGQILGVNLHAGQGVIQMEIDPSKGVKRLYKNARAVLVPNTPLKDMYVDINPGTKSAGVLPDGGTIPISDTTSPTDSDELLDELDVDTRDWFTSLITELANGTSGRGSDIRRMLTTLGPTAQQTRQIADLLARRRTELASLVHNLGVLTKATSQDDGQLATLVDSGNRTIQALASQDVALRQAIRLLPGTLAQTRTTFGHLTSFADELGPTASKLIPVAQHLPATLRDTKTLIQTSALLPINKVKSFENAIVPLTGAVTGVTSGLQTDLPPLTTTFKALQYVTNEVAYAPSAGNPGFTYWLSWFAHNVNSFVGNHDANGSGWRSLLITSCGTLGSLNPALRTLLTTVLGNFGC